ncbi:hypothetical protein [Streptomyces omiyaensis]|uniref:hypothetical protein n=1 Tax=Streptomyces omiyaensis TaxID=68247 RepID=UPI0036F7FE09
MAVRTVRAESSLVEPVGRVRGAADPTAVHGVTPSALAFPPVAVRVVGDAGAAALPGAAVGASPLLGSGGDGLPLLVEARAGRARVGGAGAPG